MTTTIPISKVSSIYESAASVFQSATAGLATETIQATTRSMLNVAQNAQATMSYYSYLQVLATATDEASVSSIQSQAAVASSVMHQLWADNTFYKGNVPDMGGNVALLVVMSIYLAFHLVAGVFYGQWWFATCFTMGLILEVLGYIGRIISSSDIESFNGYVLQMVCLILAPSFLMGGMYYTLAQLTLIVGERYSRLRPMHYSLIFIICDLISIIIQAVGGATAASALYDFTSTTPGANIMVGGIAFQVASMVVFQYFWYDFVYHYYHECKLNGDANFTPRFQFIRDHKFFRWYFVSISFTVLFIFVRSVYRLVELIQGFDGRLATTEIYFFILEALMIALAVLPITVLYPGFIFGRNPGVIIDKGLGAIMPKKKKEMEMSSSSDNNHLAPFDDDSRTSTSGPK